MRDSIAINNNKIMFRPGMVAALVNPSYLLRSNLFNAISHFSSRFNGTVLDYGCGSKPYKEIFNAAESYIGLDIEVSGHDHTSSEVDVFFDGKAIPFDDSHFDGIVTFETLEHVFDIDLALSEFYRVLKTDGSILITVPFAWPEHEVPYDFGRYTSYGMTHLLEKHGFEICEITKTGNYFLVIAQLTCDYIRDIFFPKSKIARALLNAILLFPITATAIMLNFIMPKRKNLYFNLVVIAKKSALSDT